jgi:hypothetical protein
MNQKHILFPLPWDFSPPSLAQNFIFSPLHPPTFFTSFHFMLIPSLELGELPSLIGSELQGYDLIWWFFWCL